MSRSSSPTSTCRGWRRPPNRCSRTASTRSCATTPALAEEVIERDDEVDQLNYQMYRELLSYMAEDPHTIPRATRLLFISKYLERIADHATNIAEMVVFMVKGRTIRHMDKKKHE